MSAQAISHVWDIPNVTAEERLALIWLANTSGGLGYPIMPEWIGLGDFIGADYDRACAVVGSLADKGLVHWGTVEEETSSYVWLTYSGPYYPPIDWTGEVKRRSTRVAALIERDGPECAYCDCIPVNYHVDHFLPTAKGGPDRMSNLVLACPPCNQAKKDKLPEHFLRDNPRRFYVLSTNLKYLHE